MRPPAKKNDLIAQFMGYERDKMEYFIPQHGKINSQGNWIDTFSKENLKFHKSWDWLMPVVEKVNSTVFEGNACRVTMRSNATLIEKVGEEGWEAGPIVTGEVMLKNTFKAIIEFIEWFNNQK